MNLDIILNSSSVILRLPTRPENGQMSELLTGLSSDLTSYIKESEWDPLFAGTAMDITLSNGNWRMILNRLRRTHDFNRKERPGRMKERVTDGVYEDEPLTFTVNGVVYTDARSIPTLPEETISLGQFEQVSKMMVGTDPCYSKGTWCAVTFKALPGTWHAQLTRRDDKHSGHCNAILLVAHKNIALSSIALNKLDKMEKLKGTIGVDSGQAGFFDKKSYPQEPDAKDESSAATSSASKEIVIIDVNDTSTPELQPQPADALSSDRVPLDMGESDTDDEDEKANQSWYEKVCDITLADDSVNAGIAPGLFGVVSQTFYGDGGYPCFVKRNDAGQVVAAVVVFDDSTGEDDENDED